jgi:hypothetical protein
MMSAFDFITLVVETDVEAPARCMVRLRGEGARVPVVWRTGSGFLFMIRLEPTRVTETGIRGDPMENVVRELRTADAGIEGGPMDEGI